MTEQAKFVVDGFRHLTPDEQTQAFLEVEKIWKDQQDDATASNAPTPAPQEKGPGLI
jgi:hypothetical protein